MVYGLWLNAGSASPRILSEWSLGAQTAKKRKNPLCIKYKWWKPQFLQILQRLLTALLAFKCKNYDRILCRFSRNPIRSFLQKNPPTDVDPHFLGQLVSEKNCRRGGQGCPRWSSGQPWGPKLQRLPYPGFADDPWENIMGKVDSDARAVDCGKLKSVAIKILGRHLIIANLHKESRNQHSAAYKKLKDWTTRLRTIVY